MCAIVLRLCAAAVRTELVPRAGQAAALRQIRFACLPGPPKPRGLDTHRPETGQRFRGENGRRG